MTTQTIEPRYDRSPEASHAHPQDLLRYMVPLGRALFAAIFILSAAGHFSSKEIGYAAQHGVPLATVLVPLSGVLALAGGLSVLLGFKARIGAWMLVAFLVPVTLAMHAFWAETDPAAVMMQQINFMKNVSMLGAALMITYLGAGPLSLDARHSTG
jgi:putative oxidoreductase